MKYTFGGKVKNFRRKTVKFIDPIFLIGRWDKAEIEFLFPREIIVAAVALLVRSCSGIMQECVVIENL